MNYGPVTPSVLADAKLMWEPFPHVQVCPALPWEFYRELESTFPEDAILNRPYSDNQRIDLHAKDAEGKVPDIWWEFIQYHTSFNFWLDVNRVFGPAFKVCYPTLVHLELMPTGMRGRDKAWMQLECQPGVNTPTSVRSRVRGPHLDNPIELYGGLLYMGEGEGDLNLYELKTHAKYHGKLEIEDDCVDVVKTVKYQPNSLVMFVNTLGAIHGVTERGPSTACRRLVSIAGEVPGQLFKTGHGKY